MSVNFSNTTPAAPGGATNILWQTDGSGNVSGYVTSFASAVVSVDLTAQTANISPTTLFTPTASGRFRVSGYAIVTQAATTSSTLPSIVITWTDPDNSTAQSLTLTATAGGNLLTTYAQATGFISAKISTPIAYSTTGFASSGATPMQYALHIKLEQF
jgi:hypothetical protein